MHVCCYNLNDRVMSQLGCRVDLCQGLDCLSIYSAAGYQLSSVRQCTSSGLHGSTQWTSDESRTTALSTAPANGVRDLSHATCLTCSTGPVVSDIAADDCDLTSCSVQSDLATVDAKLCVLPESASEVKLQSTRSANCSEIELPGSKDSSSQLLVLNLDNCSVVNKVCNSTANSDLVTMPASIIDSIPVVSDSNAVSCRKKLVPKRRSQATSKNIQGDNHIARRIVPPAEDLSHLVQYVPHCLEKFGFCVVDGFVGDAHAKEISDEVCQLDKQGIFEDGLLTNKAYPEKAVRGDRVFWLEHENVSQFSNICKLLSFCDELFLRLRGKLGSSTITSRTKSMLACYPGEGRRYRRHIDNPNQDGRCITCIYYLNPNWCREADGGILRLYPSSLPDQTVDIEPRLDRLLLFWSDHRTPHEVLPTFRNRYALTVWYFDEEERHQARLRFANEGSRDNPRLEPVNLVCNVTSSKN